MSKPITQEISLVINVCSINNYVKNIEYSKTIQDLPERKSCPYSHI